VAQFEYFFVMAALEAAIQPTRVRAVK